MDSNGFFQLIAAHVSDDIFLRNVTYAGPTALNSLDIGSSLSLNNSKFQYKNTTNSSGDAQWGLSLFDIKAKKIYLNDIEIAPGCSNELRSLHYDDIYAAPDNDPDGWQKLLGLYERADLSVEDYAQLEGYYRKAGEENPADEVFIQRLDRERDQKHGLSWVGSTLMKFFLNYGKSPWRIWLWSLGVVVFGVIVFHDSRKMEQQDPTKPPRNYESFWYSFDLFLPVIKLSAADFWKPKEDYGFLRVYMRIHTLIGWILIPLGLAAVSGLLK